jgi:transcriptional regulator with XRE-family HTH domain
MDVRTVLARNLRSLREARGLTQTQLAALAKLPRATWANLESGAGNPTLSVLQRVAHALQVTIEELTSAPRAAVQRYPKGSLPSRVRNGNVTIQKLLPDPIPGMEMDRLELPPRATLIGVPHTDGTREYLTCESGEVVLTAAGESFHLEAGDVVAFRGDQRHSYHYPGPRPSVCYSVVILARVA